MCIFSEKGLSAFLDSSSKEDISAFLAILCSRACSSLIEVQLAAADRSQAGGVANAYEVGIIKSTPAPLLDPESRQILSNLARRAWSLKRILDTAEETSHAFLLPEALSSRVVNYDPLSIDLELAGIQASVDSLTYELYGFSKIDQAAMSNPDGARNQSAPEDDGEADDDVEEESSAPPVDHANGLLSWAVGVAFGRFDWRLATGERSVPNEPEPFDPLPAKSPGMLPDGAAPFHDNAGILVDDRGHPHDLARLIEEVLACVNAEVPGDVRRWLQRDFFSLHLKQYSKSRRKAPTYWPLSTSSGSYTLWLYYPSLTSQTLYTAVNDFLDPKLKQVSRDTATLRDRGAARSREDEKALEALQTLELELIELRDTLLQIAPTYRPMQDDGVQITAAPLWQLFRHKPWQKILQDTWAKLKKGDYDWAHLASAYWPERVREKCRTDKSLAIAHDLEHLYEPPEPKAAKPRGRKKADDA